MHLLHEYIDSIISKLLTEQTYLKKEIELPEDLIEIAELFDKAHKQLYLVGGAVRDAIMGKTPKDFDVATNANPDEIIDVLKQNPSYKILEVGKSFGVIKVVTPQHNEYEIATFRKDLSSGRKPEVAFVDSVEVDQQRRDLTINALFYDINKKEIVDFVGGLEDIKNGVIRAVGNPFERFEEDKLRILRVLRFSGRIGSKIDQRTSEAILSDNSLQGVSGERIRDEFLKGIKSAKNVKYFFDLVDEYDLWPQIFPGLKVNKQYKETKNIPVQLALLLRENDYKPLMNTLNKLKYSTDEVAQVSYLVMFQGLAINNAYKMKKLFKVSKLSNKDLVEFAKLNGEPDLFLLKAFVKFKPSISSEKLMAQGFSGKELGIEIDRQETELFQALL